MRTYIDAGRRDHHRRKRIKRFVGDEPDAHGNSAGSPPAKTILSSLRTKPTDCDRTGDDGTDASITFTLEGSGVVTVNTEPIGRMESGTNFVTIPSKI
jgi:hypothetical protein